MKAEKHKLGIIAPQVECKTGWWNTLFKSAPFVNPQWYSLAHTRSKCSVGKALRINKRALLEVMIDEAGGFLLFSANEWNEAYTKPRGRNETLIVWFLQEDKDMKSLFPRWKHFVGGPVGSIPPLHSLVISLPSQLKSTSGQRRDTERPAR